MTFVKLFPPKSANLYANWPEPLTQFHYLNLPSMHSRVKRKLNVLTLFAGLLLLLLSVAGCTSENPWEKESNALLSRSEQLEKRLNQLNMRIDSLWDTTTVQLAKALPADFPPIDRDIFLKARNADHIKMFMSFQHLSPEAKALVQQAGMFDTMLADQARHLRTELELFEQEKTQFLKNVEEHDPATSKAFAEKLK